MEIKFVEGQEGAGPVARLVAEEVRSCKSCAVRAPHVYRPAPCLSTRSHQRHRHAGGEGVHGPCCQCRWGSCCGSIIGVQGATPRKPRARGATEAQTSLRRLRPNACGFLVQCCVRAHSLGRDSRRPPPPMVCLLEGTGASLSSNTQLKEAAGAIEQWQKERTGARCYPDACELRRAMAIRGPVARLVVEIKFVE